MLVCFILFILLFVSQSTIIFSQATFMTLTSDIGNIIINLPWLKTTLAPAGFEPPTSQYGLNALQPGHLIIYIFIVVSIKHYWPVLFLI